MRFEESLKIQTIIKNHSAFKNIINLGILKKVCVEIYCFFCLIIEPKHVAKCGHQQILREESPDKQQNWKEPRFLEALPCIQLFGYVVWPITSDQLQVCEAGDGSGKERSPRTNPRTSQCHQLQQSNSNMSYQLKLCNY